MTGKDLIIYILANNLENTVVSDWPEWKLYTEEEAAVKFDTGINTIKALCATGKLKHLKLGETYYIYA